MSTTARTRMVTAKAPAFFGEVRVPSASALRSWVTQAVSGDQFIYCEASSLVAGETAALAKTLEQDGLVTLAQLRRAGGGYRYTAIRTSRRAGGAPHAVLAELDPASEAILRHLRRAANLNRLCPSRADLVKSLAAEDIHLTEGQLRHRLDRIIEIGLIRSTVHSDSGTNVRVVTFPATGKRTALPHRLAALQREIDHG